MAMKRELTALVAIPLLIAAIELGPAWIFLAIVGGAALLALWELQHLAIACGLRVDRVLGLVLTALVLVALFTVEVPLLVALLAVLFGIPTLHLLRGFPLEKALPSVATATFAVLYIGVAGGAIGALRMDFERDTAVRLIELLLVCVWVGDSAAYYIGRNFGRHKLAPRVSPGKSWEGAAANVAGTLLGAALFWYALMRWAPLGHVLVAAALISVGGQIGDLVESVWKRDAGVKDSGALLPGHGGILDRIDSLLFGGPLLYVYALYVWRA